MTPNETDQIPPATEADGAAQPAANDAGPAPEAAAPPEAQPEASAVAQPEALAVAEAEKADLRDKLLRALADVENIRRRTDREIADARTYAVTGFARDMLTVADNIRRALESVPEEVRAADSPARALVEGIELTERDLLKTLERHGVRPVEPDNQKFDPNLHQAMFEVPNPEVPNGTVVQVVQPGYTIAGRVLRPALVGVSKGGPKPAAAEGDPATGDGAEADASSAQA